MLLSCQMLGYLTGLAGAAVAVAMGRKTHTHLEDVHRIVGLTVTILLTIQVLAILWRPAPKHRYRWDERNQINAVGRNDEVGWWTSLPQGATCGTLVV